ncbi:KAP family P-loop NTPase fold protein [Photobacterium leiognathi]|uniref:KAP family P-loop NTPase fold protein n=1 Tax=Photobacterium leiognathi TaxID=553611 RepID=UPI00298190DF|nr:P-loop NTPase fold protein [Photobacterium leiognathi]
MKVNFSWSEPTTNDTFDEYFQPDQLDREKYAQFLTSFLAQQGFDQNRDAEKQKRNYVLNLNAEWGAGKSYFLKRWALTLEEHYPVVYIDAWKQDYSDDPLMTVISSMIKQLRKQAGKDADKNVFKVSRKLVGLLKAAAPALARGLTTKYLGVDPLKIMEMADDKAIGESINSDGQSIDMGLAAQKMVEHLISEHDAKSKSIDSLKHNVEQWIEAVKSNDTTKSYPAFIFIDELDRCRPNYAVEMLEAIKHIFDIPGVVFVVATDTEQLQHAVKAIYGEGFDAKQYLGRFFNSRYTFKTPSYEKILGVHCDTYKLSKEHLTQKEIITFPDTLDQNDNDRTISLRNLTLVYEAFGLSTRQVIQITDRLIATIDNLNNVQGLNIIYLAFLLCLREKDSELYDKVCTYSFTDNIKFQNEQNSLNNHLSNEFLWKNKYLTIELHPNSIVETFMSTPTAGMSNQWKDGIYKCSLFDFITASHLVLKLSKSEVSRKLTEQYSNHARTKKPEIDFSNGQYWIMPTFHKLTPDTINVDYYKDLVELATNLDHIDA